MENCLRICFLMLSIVVVRAQFPRMRGMRKFGFDFGFPNFPKMGRFPSPFAEKEGEDEFKSVFKGMKRPVPGMKMKVHNETKGNTTVYTVEQNGKGYHSLSQFTVSQNNPGMISEGFSEDIQSSEASGDKETRGQTECGPKKPCPEGEFCNPIANVCGKKLPLKDRCQFKEQCQGQGVNCVWGKCRKAQYGTPGCLCQKDGDCQSASYCSDRYEISPFYDVCSLKLDQGAPCGNRKGGAMALFSSFMPFTRPGGLVTRTKKQTNPCKDGLVCEPVGLAGTYTCIPAD